MTTAPEPPPPPPAGRSGSPGDPRPPSSLVGDRIQGQEALVRRMAEDGHQIGVHSYDHSCISDLSRADFDLQVGRTRGVLSAVLGSW
ncbi:MAG: polysaccharide deacetylase family protein [Flavonifractor plautii]